MNNIFALTEFHDKLPVNVIRYYNNGNGSYLIYTLNEKDANGYIKLYVAKIIENSGKYNIETIIDENEWNTVKDNIKQIINENRTNGKVSFTDLNPDVLNNTIITESKAFKLLEDLVKVLGENINIVEKASEATPSAFIQPTSIDMTGVPVTPEVASAVQYPEASVTPEVAPAVQYPESSVTPEAAPVQYPESSVTPEAAPAVQYPEAPVTPEAAPAVQYPEAPVTPEAALNPGTNEVVDYKNKYEDAQKEIDNLKEKIASITDIINK